ncbi:hypothetical protein JXX16_03670 [Ruthenibacterium lactatiformans]|uniref:hypothetical protein n=1 Tax=Ruthenibacterium lactatiformans TaxID=1550024 RepID=UPI0019688E70|nr:hypothetical protein [Ruthenibacterium lactatiformans]MBN3019251.1 hypothetical protein [Ruthenibacterium lactatiformans]
MAENSNNSTNNDILSGKGLKPISSSQPTPKQSGITTENRGQDSSGIRIDRFTKDSDKKRGK